MVEMTRFLTTFLTTVFFFLTPICGLRRAAVDAAYYMTAFLVLSGTPGLVELVCYG